MQDKTILITGATNGIGKATALKLATFGSTIVMLSRNIEKSKEVESESKKSFPNAKFIHIFMDLTDFISVKKAAEEVLARFPTIDILINNAGGIFSKKEKTKDGFEMGLQVNHLAHFLLIKLLLSRILENKNFPRIINVSSDLHKMAKIDLNDMNLDQRFSAWTQYGNAKLMNILSSKVLSKRHATDGLQTYSLHPGVVRTGFGSNNTGFWGVFNKLPFMMSPEDAAKTPVYLASQDKNKLKNGGYYKKSKLAASSNAGVNYELAEDVWAKSEELLAGKGY
jgi:NAD(P)-dependent dehydrogenase (short-subunit alcohol dehydrogenase family)